MADNRQNTLEIIEEDSALPDQNASAPLNVSAATQNTSATSQNVSETPQAVPAIHLLLIDDYPDIGTLIGKQFRDKSYQVTTVRTAEEALQLLGWKPDGNVVPTGVKVDLILTDNIMRGQTDEEVVMSGLVFLQTIKKSPMLQEIPVVLFSLDLNKLTIDRFIQEGAAGYMSKMLTGQSFTDLDKFLKKVDYPKYGSGKCCFL